MPIDLVETCKQLIAIRSISSEGTRSLVEFLAPFCRQAGFRLTFQSEGNGDAREVNLIAHTVPEGSPDLCPGGLVLLTHLDTVPPGDLSLWTETGGDPFRPTLKGDRLYGLGSADTKLDFLCKLRAVEEVGLKNIRIPLALIGTFGEERALAGARLLKESGIVHPRLALVGEPSNLQPVIAHKGILYMRAVGPHPSAEGGDPLPKWERGRKKETFRGRAAHGSMPHLGESAILKAAKAIFAEQERNPHLQLLRIDGGTVHNIVPESCVIETCEGPSPCARIDFLRRFFRLIETAHAYLESHQNEAFDPPHTTCNIGVIRSTEGQIDIEFDFRLIPETDGNDLYAVFQTLPLEAPGCRVEKIRSNAPMKTDKNSEIAKRVSEALRRIGLPARFAVKSGNTEGSLMNEMGAESIVIGPGESVGNIHAPNEYNEISQIHKAVEFYTAFLRGFC